MQSIPPADAPRDPDEAPFVRTPPLRHATTLGGKAVASVGCLRSNASIQLSVAVVGNVVKRECELTYEDARNQKKGTLYPRTNRYPTTLRCHRAPRELRRSRWVAAHPNTGRGATHLANLTRRAHLLHGALRAVSRI